MRAGTTLAELMVAVAFLALAMAPIITLVGSSQKRANDMRLRLIALSVAQTELENLRINGRNSTVASKSTTTTQTPVGALYPMTVSTTVAGTSLPNLYEATVTVTYDDNGRTVRLITRVKS